MPDSNNNPKNSPTPKFSPSTSNSSSRLRRKTLKSELKSQKITRPSLMLNGRSSMINSRKSSILVPRSSSPSCQLVISPPSTSLTEISSVLEELPLMTSTELLSPLEPSSRPPSMDWTSPPSEPVPSSKKSRLELRDSTFSRTANQADLLPSS